ncbi:hypothetical protein FRC0418_00085 [Corynebacterium diphtheriae]|nr:hypothetical protein CIP107538_00292 [Corynebacterium diphtheriae]CAB0885861.1 hypothetical protein FRC0418_00085 [Corynebacterium diphtheriae]
MNGITRISYMSPWGIQFDLSESEWTAGLRYAGLSGMKSKVQAKTLQAIGQSGQITESTQIQPMDGTITLALAGENGETVDGVYRRVCAAFSQTLVGTLSVETSLHGTIYTKVKAAAPIPAPKSDLLGETVVDSVEISLISDEGVWWTDWVRGEDTVLVTNDGEVSIPIRIRWKGKGGAVTLPSGAVFDLPPVSDWRTLILDSEESCVVIKDDGLPDYEVWPAKIAVTPELVPPCCARKFVLPTGASAMWRIALTDPWKVI